MENFGKFTTFVLGLIFSSLIIGFVTSQLWAWFVVPTFKMQPLRLVEAIGLTLLISYLKAKRIKEAEKENFWEQFALNLMFLTFYSAFVLLIGWAVSLFM